MYHVRARRGRTFGRTCSRKGLIFSRDPPNCRLRLGASKQDHVNARKLTRMVRPR